MDINKDYINRVYINKISSVIKAISYYIIVLLLSVLTIQIITTYFNYDNEVYNNVLIILIQFISFGIFGYILTPNDIKKKIISNISLEKDDFYLGMAYGSLTLISSILLMVIANLIFTLEETDSFLTDIIVESPELFIVMLLINIFLVATTEEWIFRGVIYNILNREITVIPSILFTSFLFGIIHISEIKLSPIVILGILTAFVGGIIYSYVYEEYNNLMVTIIAHAFNNTVIFIITYLSSI